MLAIGRSLEKLLSLMNHENLDFLPRILNSISRVRLVAMGERFYMLNQMPLQVIFPPIFLVNDKFILAHSEVF